MFEVGRAIDAGQVRTISDNALLLRAKALYAQRRARDRTFGEIASYFNEPAWDIALELFVAEGEGKQVSVSNACIAACVPPTTGLRWIRCLTEAGFVEEQVDTGDRRRRLLRLAPRSVRMMRAYLTSLDLGSS
jgi:hypothetical protein